MTDRCPVCGDEYAEVLRGTKVTIPKSLGDAFNLKGQKVKWSVESAKKLEVKVVDE